MRTLPSIDTISFKICLPFLAALLLFGYLIPVKAAIDVYQFDKPGQYQRYLHLTESLRCPQCQNQDIADSNAPIATNLRSIIHRMILKGKTDKEIIKFVVDRYGEFVLYKPRFDRETAKIWLFLPKMKNRNCKICSQRMINK